MISQNEFWESLGLDKIFELCDEKCIALLIKFLNFCSNFKVRMVQGLQKSVDLQDVNAGREDENKKINVKTLILKVMVIIHDRCLGLKVIY